MRTSEIKDRRRLMEAAMGRVPCDLTVRNIRLVNVLTGEIYPAEVDIFEGAVARVRQAGEAAALPARKTFDGEGRYLLPGFIDTHMHVESSMMAPAQLARAIIPWGTTTICTDPHEIANVMGMEGVRFMLRDAKRAPLRQYVLAPSCVPAVPALEGAGAAFGAEDIRALLAQEGVTGVAEIMDYDGVLENDARMAGILAEGWRAQTFLQGHAPQLSGGRLAAYRIAGPASDHESGSSAEVREKLRSGLRVNLRASSICDHLEALTEGLKGMGWLDLVSICTDDVHAKDLLEKGHINAIVARLVAGGMEPLTAVKLCTLNAAQEYGFHDLGAIAPGYMADMQLADALDGRRPHAVFIRGQLCALEGRCVAPEENAPYTPKNTMNVCGMETPRDFGLHVSGERAQAEVYVMDQRPGGSRRVGEWMTLPVKDGRVSLENHPELSFVSVVNRYGAPRHATCVTRDFGLREGAVATTVSHDSHNFTVIYRDEESAFACLEQLRKTGGGLCAAKDGQCVETLPLPIAGLMSTEDCETLAARIEHMEATMQRMCSKPFSLLSVAVYSLPVIPGLLITDRGMVDGSRQCFVPAIRE